MLRQSRGLLIVVVLSLGPLGTAGQGRAGLPLQLPLGRDFAYLRILPEGKLLPWRV